MRQGRNLLIVPLPPHMYNPIYQQLALPSSDGEEGADATFSIPSVQTPPPPLISHSIFSPSEATSFDAKQWEPRDTEIVAQTECHAFLRLLKGSQT